MPKNLVSIGSRAFANNWRLMGVLEIPEDVVIISSGAFAECRSLESIVLPSALETVGSGQGYGGAFKNCYGVGSIVCKGIMPP